MSKFILFLYLFFISHTGIHAQEFYSSRPDILTIAPSASFAGQRQLWEQFKAAMAEMVPQILELYPDRHIYFLARDGEYMYDLARLMLQDTPEMRRIHLINVSRRSRDHNKNTLRQYLIQEGIDPEQLVQGKKIVLIDTGILGTIPSAIEDLFGRFRAQITAHMGLSKHSKYPSSRNFLRMISLMASHFTTNINLEKQVELVEDLPHYTTTATRYTLVNGTLEATSDIIPAFRNTALEMQADLVRLSRDTQFRQSFQQKRNLWRRIYQNINNTEQLATIFAEISNPHEYEATVRDVVEFRRKALGKIELTVENFGLTSNINYVNHPRYFVEHFFEDFKLNYIVQIEHMISNEYWDVLGELLIQSNLPREINDNIYQQILDYPAISTKMTFIKNLFEGDKFRSLLPQSIKYFFNTKFLGNRLRIHFQKLIDLQNPEVIKTVLEYRFVEFRNIVSDEQLSLILDFADQESRQIIINNIIGASRSGSFTNSIRIIREQGQNEEKNLLEAVLRERDSYYPTDPYNCAALLTTIFPTPF